MPEIKYLKTVLRKNTKLDLKNRSTNSEGDDSYLFQEIDIIGMFLDGKIENHINNLEKEESEGQMNLMNSFADDFIKSIIIDSLVELSKEKSNIKKYV